MDWATLGRSNLPFVLVEFWITRIRLRLDQKRAACSQLSGDRVRKCRHTRAELDVGRLCLSKFEQPFQPKLTTEAALLVAAKRQLDRRLKEGVHINRAATQTPGHTVDFIDILCPKSIRQPVARMIGKLDRFFLTLKG